MTTAQTIFEQLGGRRFLLMTGANNLLSSEISLRFNIARRIVRITLNATDTYKVETVTLGGKVVATASDVYAENLRSVFTEQTGLHTSL